MAIHRGFGRQTMTRVSRSPLLAVLALTGCTSTNAIRPEEIGRLDGYDLQTSPEPRQIETISGWKVNFDRNSNLFLDLDGGSQGGHFAAIHAHDQIFEGRTTNGQDVRASITQIKGARVEQRHIVVPLLVALGALALSLIVIGALLNQDQSQPVSGRPLRIASKIVVARTRGSEGWGTGRGGPETRHLSPRVRAALADAWTTTATSEYASVPAFARISMTLVALGAPARLVEAAHRAALDEIRHARFAFGLAAAYAGRPVAPAPLPALQRASAVMASTLADLAADSVLDGCVAEGVSAAAAAEAARRATDPVVRATLEMIAADEATHAELAWDIVQWCCEEGGTDVSDRLGALVGRAPAVVGPSLPADLEPELAAHGQLGLSAWRALGNEVRVNVATRLALLARQPG
jgi:hypothetical protein